LAYLFGGSTLAIGIPYRYITEDILTYLDKASIKLEPRVNRRHFIKGRNPSCIIRLVNSTMLPDLVEDGLIDLAILPSVDFKESQTFAVPLVELNMPVARLMLGISKSLPLVPLKSLPITCVLTRTPRLTKEFLERNKLKWKMKVVRGLTESLASIYGKHYAVVEYVRSGETMAANGLVPIVNVAYSSVLVVAHPKKVNSRQIVRLKKQLLLLSRNPKKHGVN